MDVIDRKFGCVDSCGLTRMNPLYTEMMNSVRSDHRFGAWAEFELLRMRSVPRKLQSVVKESPAPHYSSKVFALESCLSDQALDGLDRFESFSGLHVRPFEHFIALIKKSCKITSPQLLTGMHKTVKNMNTALDSM